MRSIVKYSMAVITALIGVACVREPLAEPASGVLTLKRVDARVLEMPQTKAHLEDGSKIIWDLSDRIGVFSDRDDAVPFSKTNSGNTFESNESVRGTIFYAFYPYSADSFHADDRNNLTFTLDGGNAAGGSSPTLTVPMIAKSDNTTLNFKQTSGVLHFSVKGTFVLSSVVLKGNAGEKVGGTFTVDLNESEPVLKSVAGSDLTENKFTPQAPVQLSEETAYDVYFVLPPMTFENGLSVIMTDEAGTELTKATAHAVSVSRAVIKNFEVFDADELRETDDETLSIERDALIEFYNALDGPHWTNNTNWCSEEPVARWYGVIVNEAGRVERLTLFDNGLSGNLPDNFDKLSELKSLFIGQNRLTGTIPVSLKELKHLEELDLSGSRNLDFSWLDYDYMTGSIPEWIGDLPSLNRLRLTNNRFTGEIPASLSKMMDRSGAQIELYFNRLSGQMPESIINHPNFSEFAWSLLSTQQEGYKIDLDDMKVPACRHIFNTLDGESFDLGAQYARAEYTMIVRWAEWCPFADIFTPLAIDLAKKYAEKGLQTIWAYGGGTPSARQDYMAKYGLDRMSPHIREVEDHDYYDETTDHAVWRSLLGYRTPFVEIVNREGNIVFIDDDDSDEISYYSQYSFAHHRSDLEFFVASLFGDVYESTDYTADGTVRTLQTATEGAGINVVLMGDAFSDRMIADRTYDTVMNNAMEAFFSEEPYKSFRNLFNVYSVDVVSKHEVYQGETALETYYGDGTYVGGNDDKTFEYARKALTDAQMDEAMVIVMLNRDYYAGTCYMYYTGAEGDYGRGPAIAYFPTSSDAATFAGLVSHEAGGHGFGKLADEYSYEGTIPDDEAQGYKDKFPLGWWKNIDFTDDLSQVKWAQFLNDERYANEGLGAYEGGCTYALGVWHPTAQSIMNLNVGGFNAPSRYAIWYRIGKLAYGDDWAGSYEDFVAYDAVNRQQPTAASRHRSFVEKQLPPLAPPVVVSRDWREAKR